jgi:ribosomal protein L16/L10AE
VRVVFPGIGIQSDGDNLRIKIEVAAPEQSITENQVSLVREALERDLERPVELEVNVFPMQTFYSKAQQEEQVGLRQKILRTIRRL